MEHITKVHFIGIGGIGMSALARLFLHEGKEVSGSDSTETELTKALMSEGAQIRYEQVAGNITDDIDLVVYTEAMAHDHEELVAAREIGIKTINYFEALGIIANEYFVIAVAGSHGKTTTTAMLIDIFESADLDPTAVVGSLRATTKSNFRAGKGKYFIVEACEYKRDFMTLEPDVLVITNLELEHVDYYKSLEEVQTAFRDLAFKVPEDGAVVANLGDKNIKPVIDGLRCNIIDYTKSVNPLLRLKQPGLHNHLNAAAAVAAAGFVDVEPAASKQALEEFAGTWRRFEYKGEVNDAAIYDDYAHHPTEIRAAIQGARELYPSRKVTVIFQSHTYTRTAELFDDFVSSLAKADTIIIAPIYAAREINESGVTHHKLAVAIQKNHPSAHARDTFDEIADHLKKTVTGNDVVLVMGAGNITQVTDLLLQ